jgi:DNA/RNA endonuclease YhcR with UshA esterase domain
MRIAYLTAALVFAATPALAEDIPVTDAAMHAGQTGTVVGVLSGVHKDAKKNIYLDMGGNYPDNAFSGILYPHGANPPDFSTLIGKTLAITGKIKMYHGKPEIVIDSSDQVKIGR